MRATHGDMAPLEAVLSEDGEMLLVHERRGLIATMEAWMDDPKEAESGRAEAEYIVRAVNNHEELLEAATVVVESIRVFHKSQGFDRIGYREDLPSWAQPLQKAIEKASG